MSDLTYDKRLEYLGIQSLESSRKISALKMLYKIRNFPQKMPINWSQNFDFYQISRNGFLLELNLDELTK